MCRTCSTGCPVTLSLAAGAAVLWLVGGVATGVVSALRRGSVFDRAAMGVALAGVSLPIFFTGLLALAIFSYKLGSPLPAAATRRSPTNPAQWAYDLILPWITLAFLYAAAYARLTRAGMLETMSEDYIRTARAKGLPERDVVVKHGLRGALTPILTIFGLDLGLLLGGAVLTESTFSLPGPRASTPIDAITNNDLPKVLGRHPGRGVLRHHREPGRGPAVRRHRPASPAHVTDRRRPPPTAAAARAASTPFLDVRDLRVHFPTDDGLVSRWTGCRSGSSAARPSASSASPARARA